MDMRKLLQLGEHIIIEYGNDSYKTTVQDVLSDKRFLVAEPTIKSIPVRIPSKAIVNMACIKPDSTYRFAAEMNGLYVINELRMLRFLARTEPIRMQRRSHYRLPIDLAINVNITEKSNDETVGEKVTTQTIDISEGGLSFVSQFHYPEGGKLLVEPVIPNSDLYEIEAEVVRCALPPESDDLYIVSVKFLDCPELIRRSLGKFIMSEQIRRRRLS